MMFWGSAPEGRAGTHPVRAHLFHWALQHLSHSGRDVAKEGGQCLASMKLTLEKTTEERCLVSHPMTKGRDGNFKEREILLHSYKAHFYPVAPLLFPGCSHLLSLVSSTGVSESLSPLGDEGFTLLWAGNQKRPHSSLRSTPCWHLFYGLVCFTKPCTAHLMH